MFPCSEITSFMQNYKLACVCVLLDGTVQNSVLSYLTFNIRNNESFGRRRLLDSDADGVFGHPVCVAVCVAVCAAGVDACVYHTLL